MKTLSYIFTTAILLASASLTSAQDKTDSIKVIYERQNSSQQASPEYYIDSVLTKGAVIEMFKPIDIDKINVVSGGKGKIYITLKKDVPYKFVTLQSLSNRFLKKKENKGLLYTVDGKLFTNAESIINEHDILSVSIADDQIIPSLSDGKVTIFKVLTRSNLNIENANKTYIRGNGLGSR